MLHWLRWALDHPPHLSIVVLMVVQLVRDGRFHQRANLIIPVVPLLMVVLICGWVLLLLRQELLKPILLMFLAEVKFVFTLNSRLKEEVPLVKDPISQMKAFTWSILPMEA